MNNPRGSVWRKWDLHVHTPISYEQEFGNDWDEYVKQLKRKAIEHGISVMGVTDYFSVDGYEILCDEYEPKEKPLLNLENGNILYLIPNVELRLDNFGDGDVSINLHILFSEQLSATTIRDSFLEELDVSFRGNKVSCKENNLIKIGFAEINNEDFNANLNIEDISDDEKKRYLRTALRLITFNFGNIKNELYDLKKKLPEWGMKRDSYAFLIAAKGHGGLDSLQWVDELSKDEQELGRAGNIRQALLFHSDACFTNHKADIDFCLGLNQACPTEEFQRRFKDHKPCIWGSDAHESENLFHPSNGATTDYTWIKGDPTFEGFKQTLFEPKYRVHIGENSPPPPPKSIDKLSISIPQKLYVNKETESEKESFCIKGDLEINFSPNLNCLIGGRGTGKSTLLNLIQLKINDEANSLYDKSEIIDEEGKVYNLKEVIDITGTSSENIEFLNQNEIEQFALNTQEFTKVVYDRLQQIGDREELKEKRFELIRFLEIVETGIERQERIIRLKEEKGRKERIYKDKKKEISILEDEEYERLQNEINNHSKELTTLRNSRKRLGNFLEEITELIQKYTSGTEEDTNQFDETLIEIRASLQAAIDANSETVKNKSDREEELEEELEKSKEELEEYLSNLGYESENISNISSAQSEANELEAEIEKADNEIKVLEKRNDSIDMDDKKREEFENLITPRIEGLNDRLKAISETTQEVEEIALKHEFNKERAFEDFCKKFNKNVLPTFDSGTSLSAKDVKSLLKKFFNEGFELKPDVDIINILNEERNELKTYKVIFEFFNSNWTEHLKLFRLYHLVYKSDIEEYLKIKVTYDGRDIRSSSFGQRCTAAMVILLSMGNNPIIIDEPEAHLDSGLIAKYLVTLIKERKQHRQIIFATHNANFVINGDSELIHILNMNDENLTEVTPTTIENMDHRESLYNLEGGKEAFIQREKKYSF